MTGTQRNESHLNLTVQKRPRAGVLQFCLFEIVAILCGLFSAVSAKGIETVRRESARRSFASERPGLAFNHPSATAGSRTPRGTTYTVTDPSDTPDDSLADGILRPPTLRAAVENANRFPDLDEIRFDPSLTEVMKTTVSWPNIIYPVIIDGTVGGSGRVAIDGNNVVSNNGLVFINGGCTIKNLEIRNFYSWGILLSTNAGNPNTVQNCDIHDNGSVGINLNFSDHNVIGGSADSARNYIYDNGDGINIISNSNYNSIVGNYIGTRDGLIAKSNDSRGVLIEGIGNVVRGNVISGNGADGIEVHDQNTQGNIIESNLIGVNSDGNSALPNMGNGINVLQGSADTIRQNTISGNNFRGISISSGVTNLFIEENFIGSDFAGEYPIGNGYSGIGVSGRHILIQGNLIGGNLITGIDLYGDSNLVRDNIVGDYDLSTMNLGNKYSGIDIAACRGNEVGGSGDEDGNLISGNGANGVRIRSFTTRENIVEGNYIGTSSSGLLALGNDSSGVHITHGAKANTIKGNVISGNTQNGVSLTAQYDSLPRNNIIENNLIGLTADTARDLGNGRFGVFVDSSWSNFIGGDSSKANFICGNDSSGIRLSFARYTEISGNFIGMIALSSELVGNDGDGIVLDSSFDNFIGDRDMSKSNSITQNRGAGVRIVSGKRNFIAGNDIHQNDSLGINLVGHDIECGITPNDPADADAGANSLQNFPTLTYVSVGGGYTEVKGFLEGISGETYSIDFYSVFEPDATGFGEADSLIGGAEISPDSTGTAFFHFQITGEYAHITATATDWENSTSEFCKAPIMVNSEGDNSDVDPENSVCNSGDMVGIVPECALRAALELAEKLPGPDYIVFDIPGAIDHLISPTTALPIATKEVIIDGTQQIGYIVDSPTIHIDGNLIGGQEAGIFLSDSGSEVRGVVVSRFGSVGIRCSGSYLKLHDVRAISNKRQGIFCDGDVSATGSLIVDSNGTTAVQDAGIDISGTLKTERIQVSNNIGAGIVADRLFVTGNLVADSNLFHGVKVNHDIAIEGEQHSVTGNGGEGMMSLNGGIQIAGHLVANGNGAGRSHAECIGTSHGALLAEHGIILDGVEVTGNCGNGIVANTVWIKGDCAVSDNSEFGLVAFGDLVRLEGQHNEFLNNGYTGFLANSADVHLSGMTILNNNGTRTQSEDPSNCLPGEGDPDSEYGAGGLYAHRTFAEDIEANGNCGSGIAGGEFHVSGAATLNYNSSHGVVGRVIKIATGQICSNEGYGVVVRPTGPYAPGGYLDIGATEICNNSLGGILGQPSPSPSTSPVAWWSASTSESPARIRSCTIDNNAGDGVNWQIDDTLEILNSNVFNNSGFGLHATVGFIDAGNNWWGDPTGPAGAGAGLGDEVSANVGFAGWLNQAEPLAVSLSRDTLFIPPGSKDSVTLFVSGWINSLGLVDVDLVDSAGWVMGPLSTTLDLSDTLPGRIPIHIAVPIGTPSSSQLRLQITATQQSDSSFHDSSTLIVLTYQPELASIVIVPDSVLLEPGASVSFFAFGRDQTGNEMAFGKKWSATGGSIDGAGRYTADNVEGNFTVTVSDSSDLLSSTAQVQVAISSDIPNDGNLPLPSEFVLEQNYPNPFNPATSIDFAVPIRSHVTVDVFNLIGQRVATLIDDDLIPGVYKTAWIGTDFDGRPVASGLYVYRLRASGFVQTKKMVLLK